jgi:hypothetical protein
MLTQINHNLKKMKALGLDHFVMSTEAEGLTQSDMLARLPIMRAAEVPVWVTIGGCGAVGDIKTCLGMGVAGITAPMIESEFAMHKFITKVEIEYKLKGFDRIPLSIQIDTKTAINNFIDICRDTRVVSYAVNRNNIAGSAGHLDLEDKTLISFIKEIKPLLSTYQRFLIISGSLTPANVNQIITDCTPNFVATTNFCFAVPTEPGQVIVDMDKNGILGYLGADNMSEQIKLALETEVLLLKYFNEDSKKRIEENEGRLGDG